MLFKAPNIVTAEVIHHGFFYTEGVKATNRTRIKCISSRAQVRVIEERWQSSLGGLNRLELRSLFHQFFTKNPIDRSIAFARGDASAFSHRKAVNFSSCHFALKLALAARYRRFTKLVTDGQASGYASASITPRDKYVWARVVTRSIHKQIASKDERSRRCVAICDTITRSEL